MANSNTITPRFLAPPSSPILVAASGAEEVSATELQLAVTSGSIPVSKPVFATENNSVGAENQNSTHQNSFPTPMRFTPITTLDKSADTAYGRYELSSCSDKAYIPTPYNSPHILSGIALLAAASSERAASRARGDKKNSDSKPFNGMGSGLRGGGLDQKVYLRGGGPKKRPAAPTTNSRKKGKKGKKDKKDEYEDVDILLSDTKSRIFKEDTNIKAIFSHPMAKQAVVDEGKSYPFEQMSGEEIATISATFKDDGACGRYNIEWLRQALAASAARAAGVFDKYVEDTFKEDWAEHEEVVPSLNETDNEEKAKGQEMQAKKSEN